MRAGSDFSFCPMHAVSRLVVRRPRPTSSVKCARRPSDILYFPSPSPLSRFRPSFSSPPSKREIVAAINGLRRSVRPSAVSDNLTAVAATAAGHNNGSVGVASVSLCQGGPMLSLSLFQPFFPLPDNIQYQLQMRTKPLLPLKSARQRRVYAGQTEHFYPLYSDHLRLGTLKLL